MCQKREGLCDDQSKEDGTYEVGLRLQANDTGGIGMKRVEILSPQFKPIGVGTFHQWGTDTINDELSYTIAIVEQDDGSMRVLLPEYIKFIKELS